MFAEGKMRNYFDTMGAINISKLFRNEMMKIHNYIES